MPGCSGCLAGQAEALQYRERLGFRLVAVPHRVASVDAADRHVFQHREIRDGCGYLPMRNSPLLPLGSLLLAVILVIATLAAGDPADLLPLTELQLGAIGAALTLAVFGIQGLLSITLEGQELHPGQSTPRLTQVLSTAIVITELLLLIDAVLLGYGIVTGGDTTSLGVMAGIGCLLLAVLLLFYKEAFLGDEARFDDREDGIPW